MTKTFDRRKQFVVNFLDSLSHHKKKPNFNCVPRRIGLHSLGISFCQVFLLITSLCVMFMAYLEKDYTINYKSLDLTTLKNFKQFTTSKA